MLNTNWISCSKNLNLINSISKRALLQIYNKNIQITYDTCMSSPPHLKPEWPTAKSRETWFSEKVKLAKEQIPVCGNILKVRNWPVYLHEIGSCTGITLLFNPFLPFTGRDFYVICWTLFLRSHMVTQHNQSCMFFKGTVAGDGFWLNPSHIV